MKDRAVIREYGAQDKEKVMHLLRLNTPVFFSPEEEKDLEHYLEDEIENYYVLVVDKEVVGSGGINLSEGGATGKLSWDLLHPSCQGQGLGTILLQHRINRLKDMEGVQKITVRTSQLVYGFYEKSGFEVREKVKDYWALGFDLYDMEYIAW